MWEINEQNICEQFFEFFLLSLECKHTMQPSPTKLSTNRLMISPHFILVLDPVNVHWNLGKGLLHSQNIRYTMKKMICQQIRKDRDVLFKALPAHLGRKVGHTWDNSCYISFYSYQLLTHLLTPTWWMVIWNGGVATTRHRCLSPAKGRSELFPISSVTVYIDQHPDIPYFLFCCHLISANPWPTILLPIAFWLKWMQPRKLISS